MRRVGIVVASLATVAALAGSAAAQYEFDDTLGENDPCTDPIDEPQAVAWREHAMDLARGACVNGEAGARVAGRLILDEPEFYGTAGGDLTIETAFVESDRFEWGLGFRAVDVAFVQNAVWKKTEVSYGPLSAHGAASRRTTLRGRPLVQSVVVRLALPFTESRLDSTSGALQVQGLATWQVRTRTRLHARAMLLGWYGESLRTSTRGALAVAFDGSWRANRWLALTGGVDVQTGWHGLGLDHVAARGGVRWRVRGNWRAELGVGLPLLGTERQLVAGTFAVRRDLD